MSYSWPILSTVTFLPLLGALLICLLRGRDESAFRNARFIALWTTLITFTLSLILWRDFDPLTAQFQFVELRPWLGPISFHMGIDGISMPFVLLTTFLMPLCILASWVAITERVKEYMIAFLVLETLMLGVFTSLDLVLFYLFFEGGLIPMFLIIGIWGGPRRVYASFKFFLYTLAGSLLMLLAIMAIYWEAGTTDIPTLLTYGFPASMQTWLWFAFLASFAVKLPMWPVHTWLPDAHVEAPTAGSVILAGVLLKMGTYGFLRFVLPFFPDVIRDQVVPIMVLAVVGILYGAVVAAIQPDVKKLVAYSSVSHMGFVLLGIFSLTHAGMMGGAFQQLNHGISTGALFLLIGLIYERRHTRMFKDYGGLKAQMPIYAAIFLIVMLSSVGLPGTNGFIGEFLALMGAFQASYQGWFGLNLWFAVLAGAGVILAAVYLLWMFQKLFYGPNSNPENHRLKDLKPWEIAMCATLVLFIFWGGLYPNTFLKPMEASISASLAMSLSPVV